MRKTVRNQYRFTNPPKSIRRARLDNIAIVPPLDDGKTVPALDQQMSALLFDDGRVHVLFLFAAQRCIDDPHMQKPLYSTLSQYSAFGSI